MQPLQGVSQNLRTWEGPPCREGVGAGSCNIIVSMTLPASGDSWCALYNGNTKLTAYFLSISRLCSFNILTGVTTSLQGLTPEYSERL